MPALNSTPAMFLVLNSMPAVTTMSAPNGMPALSSMPAPTFSQTISHTLSQHGYTVPAACLHSMLALDTMCALNSMPALHSMPPLNSMPALDSTH